jgi:hypothetical protein
VNLEQAVDEREHRMRDPDDVRRSTPDLRSILSSPAGSRRATAGQRADHGRVAGRRRARTGPRSRHRDRGDRRREANPAADVAELAAALRRSAALVRSGTPVRPETQLPTPPTLELISDAVCSVQEALAHVSPQPRQPLASRISPLPQRP